MDGETPRRSTPSWWRPGLRACRRCSSSSCEKADGWSSRLKTFSMRPRSMRKPRLGRLCLRPLHRGFRMERGRMLKVFNTMTGRKDPFEPLVPGQVRMYVCGVTVYDDVHLGHARSAVVFDVIRRYLEYRGFNVMFVKNFTDVDDKI